MKLYGYIDDDELNEELDSLHDSKKSISKDVFFDDENKEISHVEQRAKHREENDRYR